MPPKKKGEKAKKAKKGKQDGTEGMGFALPEDQIKHLQCINKSLEMQLAYRSEATINATEDAKTWMEKANIEAKKCKEEKQLTLDLTRDMTRQYKSMEDQLLNKINERENTIQDLTDKVAEMEQGHNRTIQQKDETISNKNNEIAAMKNKMEELGERFAEMLRDLTRQMSRKIELNSIREEGQEDAYIPIEDKMEAFNVHDHKT
uniref:Dynein regulatory complex protein 12 n=1 Tax=Leptocylindrus danicus TaxID=163516 RepID=A0A6U2MRJ1_9STRA|mmetsp:Transcript_18434/g.27376  ORF Transcript_18434/g.27376 Transcript_18434/m.27376 type:complete len:204 (+) Transcript_18434:393-1004(+)|eukprot:CAMPEP_0116014716 /NCGR_PEP_ID=MMETSP0321-20121206/6421_1 /TAXON_ID=163516 /ORGANISM="Leptocylindrus danicus var. danicus, Strain B650" /LENGTH=203 /DNA_ID=CAMNT_0003484377 /DNA_START=681 /DNA_END=1295 /DNA_ORIENTATION=+